MGLSNAERQARWRAKRDAELLALRRHRQAGQAKAGGDMARLEAENAALAKELAQAKQDLAQAKARTAELERQRMRIAELETRGEQPQAGADGGAELAALREENYKFRVELEARNHAFKTRAGGGLTNAQFRMLQQCCHPDNSASPKTRAEGIRLINQLRYVLCNEAELPSMDPKKFSTWARALWARRQQEIKEVKKHAKRRRQAPKASPRPQRNLPKG
jgi:hypothetical protein